MNEWRLELLSNSDRALAVAAAVGGHFVGQWQGEVPAGGRARVPLHATHPTLPGCQRCTVVVEGGVQLSRDLRAHCWPREGLVGRVQWTFVDLSRWRKCLLEELLKELDTMDPPAPYPLAQEYMRAVEFCRTGVSTDALREQLKSGMLTTQAGIPFALGEGPVLVAALSLWGGCERRIEVPLAGRADAAYLLLAGLTTAMQSHISNAMVTVHYADGGREQLELVNPINLDSGLGRFGPYHYGCGWPVLLGRRIESDDAVASTAHAPHAKDTSRPPLPVSFLGVDAHADVLCLPLDNFRPLRLFSMEVLANEVVLALLGLSLLRLC
jgi:hypothetical protein